MVKERKGAEQLRWPGVFLLSCSLSEPLHVVSPHGLVWASSQPDSLRGSGTAYMVTEGFKGKYSSEPGRKLYHLFLSTLENHRVISTSSVGYKLPSPLDGKIVKVTL